MRFVAPKSSVLLLLSLSLPRLAFAQADEELSEEEIAALEAEAEAQEKADAEAKKSEGEKPKEPASAPKASEKAPADAEDDPGAGVDAVFEPGQEPFRPAPKGKGVVWGRLVDSKTGEPAIEAQITVKGTKTKTITDFDGYYRLELPAGTYTLEVFYELHEPVSLAGVQSVNGKVSRVDVPVKPQDGVLEEVVFQDEAEKQTVAGLALQRQRSASTGDAIGRAEITKTGDSNAAAAAKRVVGANIVGGRFVYVRGLGERYSNSLLSGFPLPSPEPDRAAVPLDVFPANLLDSLTISKSATPDVPGDFAGGSVQIETRSVPEKPLFSVQLTGGWDSQATDKNRYDYGDSSTDFLGFDDGTRALPSSVPRDQILTDGISDAQAKQLGVDLNTKMSPGIAKTPFNHGFSVVGGNTWTFGGGQKFGALASLNYSHSYRRIDDEILREFFPNQEGTGAIEQRIDFRFKRGLETIRWGGFGKLSYVPNPNHKITLQGLHSQSADDEASFYTGQVNDQRLTVGGLTGNWAERGMSFGMLSGRHTFPALNNGELGWDLALSGATRRQPDRRDVAYTFNPRYRIQGTRETTPAWIYRSDASSGRHFFGEQGELAWGGKLDYKQPVKVAPENELALKFGGLANLKSREFSVRRFSYATTGSGAQYACFSETFKANCPDYLFTNDNITQATEPTASNPDGRPNLVVGENSKDGDGYKARLNVYAAYGMVDFDWSKTLRIVTGARVEWTDQRLESVNPATREVLPNVDVGVVNQADFLPSINLVHNVSKRWKGRYSYARTLARPQLRELAPFNFADYFGGRLTAGNPFLEMTEIDNFDARLEFWPSVTDVVAFSVFFKNLRNPIETVFLNTSDAPQATFTNSPRAGVIGIELETRKNLGFLASILSPFTVVTNFTLTHSRVDVPADVVFPSGTVANPATSKSRTLVNQAPWAFNLALDYENDIGTTGRASYNIVGPTLVEVGTGGVPDAYLQPQHLLDITVQQRILEHWFVRGTGQNLVNPAYLVTLGNSSAEQDIVRRYTIGAQVNLTLGYEL